MEIKSSGRTIGDVSSWKVSENTYPKVHELEVTLPMKIPNKMSQEGKGDQHAKADSTRSGTEFDRPKPI